MDVDFVVQDTYSLTRPDWKFVGDLQEATKLFAEAVAENYKVQETDKAPEPEDDGESSASDEGLEEDAIPDGDEDDQSSSEEAEVERTALLHTYKTDANVVLGCGQCR